MKLQRYMLIPASGTKIVLAESRKFSENCTAMLDAYAKLPNPVAQITSMDEVCAWIGIEGIHTQARRLFGIPTDQNWQLHTLAKKEFQIKTVEEHHGMKILALFLLRYKAQQMGE